MGMGGQVAWGWHGGGTVVAWGWHGGGVATERELWDCAPVRPKMSFRELLQRKRRILGTWEFSFHPMAAAVGATLGQSPPASGGAAPARGGFRSTANYLAGKRSPGAETVRGWWCHVSPVSP